LHRKIPVAAANGRCYDAAMNEFYGVKTTGVFCRTGCKSRAPLPKNVAYFKTPAAARAAGFRPCKRCRPESERQPVDERFLRVCRTIEESEEMPTLRELAEIVGLSEAHLQRTFKGAIGVSPRAYGEMVRQRRLRSGLKNGASVTDAIYDAGFTSPSQVYGRPDRLGMSPARFRAGGKDAAIVYAIVGSVLGRVLVAATEHGICRVDIDDGDAALEHRLHAEFPQAQLQREDDDLESTTSLIVRYLSGSGDWPRLPVDVRATAFQMRVWEALRAIKPGTTTTYTELAAAIGSPSAVRAVARACASNPIAVLIPCHRIVPRAGGVGGYRWRPRRKAQLLELERSYRGAQGGPGP
jgi:AraC family transcriptional regulator, regulatory protein of adaptative response / methylated-DNA-[protein]-cysteine methyltransferase